VLIKQIFAYSLILLFLVVMIKPYIPYIEYSIHKDYIAKNLCINKSKPEKECHGSCYRDKKIEENNADHNDQIPIMIKSIEVLKYFPVDYFIDNGSQQVLNKLFNNIVDRLFDLCIDEPLLPPPKN